MKKLFLIMLLFAISSYADEIYLAKEDNCQVSFDTKTLAIKGKCVPFRSSSITITCSKDGFDCSGPKSNPKKISAISLAFEKNSEDIAVSKIDLCSGRLVDMEYSCFGYVPKDVSNIVEEKRACEKKMEKKLKQMLKDLLQDKNSECEVEEKVLSKSPYLND